MPYPNQKAIQSALLNLIAKHGEPVKPKFAYDALSASFGLTQEERNAKSAKSPNIVWENRVAWARLFLVKSGDMDGTKPGFWGITQQGLAHVADLGADLEQLPIPEAVESLLQMTERTRNILLYGPPGTGKTWLVTQFAKAFTEADKVEMVTFHQSFAYEEFVEGVKPVIHEGQLSYAVVDGVLKRICRTAEKNPDSQYLLIIDEINRANIAKVLGELITLIEDDKRAGQANEVQVTLPYSGERFGVPANLTILGTMNTADRSIALLDLALRRRFTFVEMPPDPSLLSAEAAGVNLQALLTRLNKRVGALLDPDHRIGHSYLMGIETEADLHFAWYRRIVPLLQEYFYHDGERLQAVLGKAFVRETTLDAETKKALGGAYEEIARYEVRELTGEELLAALRALAG